MAEITEVIPSITAIPNRLTDTEEEFSTNALTSLTQQATFSDALNVFAEQANDLADEANTNATIASESAAAAQGASNWVGDWSDGGAGVSGTSYTYDSDFIYLLKVDLADILTSEPSPTNSDWQLINEPEIFAYVVSQFADGVATDVGYITAGADVTDYTYMIWPDDGRIYSVGSVTGTITAAFDPADGSDAGLSGNLANVYAGSFSVKYFESTAQVISNSGLISVAHGLTDNFGNPVTPKGVSFYIKCVTSQSGYSVGDIIYPGTNNSSGATTRVSTIRVDDSNITLRYGASGPFVAVNESSPTSIVELTPSNWELYLTAWY